MQQRGDPEAKLDIQARTEPLEPVPSVKVTVPETVPQLKIDPKSQNGFEFDIKDPPAELMIFYIQGLPPDIKKLIFADHFKIPLQYRKIQHVLKLPKTQSLDTTEIYKLIPMIFSDKKLNQYMCREDELFSRLWAAHLKGQRYFVNIRCPLQDFTLSWLMHLYH